MPCNSIPIALHIEANIDTPKVFPKGSTDPNPQIPSGCVAFITTWTDSMQHYWDFCYAICNEKIRLEEGPFAKMKNCNPDDLFCRIETFVIWDVSSNDPRPTNIKEVDQNSWGLVVDKLKFLLALSDWTQDNVMGGICFYMRAVYTPKGMLSESHSSVLM
jgi:hypothetical protein